MSVEALGAALAAEHAAVYGYGVAGAYLNGDARDLAREAESAHRDRRDAVALRIEAAGGELVAAAPAYALPVEVTDAASAMRLAVALEEAAAGAWREALGPTTDDERQLALDALIACAVMATRWREAAGITPLTLPFPGAT
jgi:ferritin-like protein